MKTIVKILINILLVLAMLFSSFFALEFTGPYFNIILSILILAIFITYNTRVGVKFSHRTKTIVIVILSLGCLVYLAIPKKNSACGAVAGGPACSSHYCIGLPITAMVEPICLGYKFGENINY